MTRVIGLECVNISERQWEGVRWEIRDYENGMLHFYCSDLSVSGLREIKSSDDPG